MRQIACPYLKNPQRQTDQIRSTHRQTSCSVATSGFFLISIKNSSSLRRFAAVDLHMHCPFGHRALLQLLIDLLLRSAHLRLANSTLFKMALITYYCFLLFKTTLLIGSYLICSPLLSLISSTFYSHFVCCAN